MTARAIARLRTFVPALWGAGLALLTTSLLRHGAPARFAALLDGMQPPAEFVLFPFCVVVVHEITRWLERRTWVPPLAIRILVGSTRQPIYPRPSSQTTHRKTQAGAVRTRRRRRPR